MKPRITIFVCVFFLLITMSYENVVNAEVVPVQVIDQELLDHKRRIADEKIETEKKKAQEIIDYEKQRIYEHYNRQNKMQEDILIAERKRVESLAEIERKKQEQEKERLHVEWRLKNPRLAQEEDRIKEEQHQRDLEKIKLDQEWAERNSKLGAKIITGAVIGGVVAYLV